MARRQRAGRDAAKEARTDEIYNARRRAKRSLERLDRDIKAGKVKNTRQVRAYRAEIMRQISESYQGKKPTEAKVVQAQGAARNLDRYTVGACANAVQRRNVMFRANMKAGSAVRALFQWRTCSCFGTRPSTHGRAAGATDTPAL